MWEYHAKVLFNKINSRFANHAKRNNIFSTLENSLEKLAAHFKATTTGKTTFASPYSNIDVNHILTKLENLDDEAQAYYNYWNSDIRKVDVAEATKEVAKVTILLSISSSFYYCSFFPILFLFSYLCNIPLFVPVQL